VLRSTAEVNFHLLSQASVPANSSYSPGLSGSEKPVSLVPVTSFAGGSCTTAFDFELIIVKFKGGGCRLEIICFACTARECRFRGAVRKVSAS